MRTTIIKTNINTITIITPSLRRKIFGVFKISNFADISSFSAFPVVARKALGGAQSGKGLYSTENFSRQGHYRFSPGEISLEVLLKFTLV